MMRFRQSPITDTGGVGLLILVLSTFVGCDVPISGSSYRASVDGLEYSEETSEFEEQPYTDDDDSMLTGAATRSSDAENQVPLPPDWPVADVAATLGDDGLLPYHGRTTSRPTRRSAATSGDTSAATSAPKNYGHRQSGLLSSSYRLMLAVFVIPLAVLVPVIWVWYLVRTLRADRTIPRTMPLSNRSR